MADEILSVTSLQTTIAPRRTLAVGMNLGRLTGILVQAGDFERPAFHRRQRTQP